ncbi:ferredoxin-thioredoxin reductase catalytic domain-containing protein [Scytonema sp. NUACC21]
MLHYKYDFMPKGILMRFIVETHPWIEEQKLVWRSGVVLNKDQTRAEVIEHYNQKEIKIRVTFWNCPCVPMRERKECHCMLFLTPDNEFAGNLQEISLETIKEVRDTMA